MEGSNKLFSAVWVGAQVVDWSANFQNFLELFEQGMFWVLAFGMVSLEVFEHTARFETLHVVIFTIWEGTEYLSCRFCFRGLSRSFVPSFYCIFFPVPVGAHPARVPGVLPYNWVPNYPPFVQFWVLLVNFELIYVAVVELRPVWPVEGCPVSLYFPYVSECDLSVFCKLFCLGLVPRPSWHWELLSSLALLLLLLWGLRWVWNFWLSLGVIGFVCGGFLFWLWYLACL